MRTERKLLHFDVITMESDDSGNYLEYLNKCFPGWGGQRQYDELFRTDLGAGFADRLLAYHAGEVVGGTSVTYRLINNSNGVTSKMAVMTGTWTFRRARGRGCYEKLLSAMQQTAIEKDCVLICGYTTKKNATYNSMLKQGLVVVNSNYLMSNDPVSTDTVINTPFHDFVPLTNQLAQQHFGQLQQTGGSAIRFVYDYDIWKIQFLENDNPIYFLSLDEESSAIIKIESGQFKVLSYTYSINSNMQLAMTKFLKASRTSGTQLFMYTLDSRVAEAATSSGLENSEGGFFLRHANQSAFREWLSLGKHLPLDDDNLLNAEHPSWAGDWVIQNSDRA